MAKTLKCRGDLIRYYRERLGWTQVQLAVRSGYSERLIRKVEEGRPARQSTLEVLAQALSSDEVKLTAADFSTEPAAVAQAFVRGYLHYKEQAATRCAYLFHPDVVLVIHTDPNDLAFGGEFAGVEGIDRMIRTAYSQFEVIHEDFGKWFTNGTKVAALRQQILKARHVESPRFNTWILHEYTIASGRIKRIDNYIDAAVYLKLLEYDAPSADQLKRAIS